MIIQGGNIQKTPTTFTAPYVQLLYGCYLVPYDTAHNLKVVRDTFSDDGRAGTECFDRSEISSNVDIDIVVDKVEVRQVSSSGSLFTLEQVVSGVVTAMTSRVVENGMTGEEITRLMASVLLGKLTGAGTGTEKFRDLADTKDRITAIIDNSGNRTAITLDAS